VAAATLAATLGVVAPPPAAADTAPADVLAFVPTSGSAGATLRGSTRTPTNLPASEQVLSGQFSAALGGDLFLYNPGSAPDRIVHISAAGSGTSASSTPKTVNGTFRPFVGDFTGDGIDDIFWYAPGSAADFIWVFKPDGSHTSVSRNVSGTYRPIVLDADGDQRDDIVWYGPGSVPDSIWYMGPGATVKSTRTVSIGGDYRTAVGQFGLEGETDQHEGIVFYSTTGNDYLWTFDAAGKPKSHSLPVLNGDYRPLPGQFIEETYGSLFMYGPGSLPEKLYFFGPGPGADVSVGEAPQVSGTYRTQVGDFDADGLTDIAFSAGSTTNVWRFTFSGVKQSTYLGLPSGATRTVGMG
jgi:hypothetical protein